MNRKNRTTFIRDASTSQNREKEFAQRIKLKKTMPTETKVIQISLIVEADEKTEVK